MSFLPAVPSYPLPHLPADAFPDWSLDPRRTALLIHDMQNYYLRPFAPAASPLADLLANAAALRETCVEANIPVLYSVQPGGQDPDERGLLTDRWGNGPGPDPADTDLPPVLIPNPSDRVIIKSRYSAFHNTNLDEALTHLDCDQLLICGVYAHIGVLATVLDAFMRDIQPFVIGDAIADLSAHHHAMALNYVASCCGRVVSTSQVKGALGTRTVPTS
ncbi:isochorismatase family protein [Nonomuraea salmonea]|uniref:Isochorismatase family protein n=1 Tax=Nonomuraea salmonea TaxID=46181 RepID=A0ABV5NMV8_9ACTN